jgi:hypothetical protein
MKLEERSFGGDIFRPTPEIHIEDTGTLAIVATPWGQRASSKRLMQSIVDFFHSARTDAEVTSPFQRLSCLTSTGNSLRSALMMTNDLIYREDNKDEYLSGFELFAAARQNQELTWTTVGQPHVFLLRKKVFTALSVAVESSVDPTVQAPLPLQLLGLFSTSNFEVRTIKLQPEDKIVLLSRSQFPSDLFLGGTSEPTLDSLSLKLAKDNSRMPFWLGILEP